jgi:hypothetical protein
MSFGPMDGWSWTTGGEYVPPPGGDTTGMWKQYRCWEIMRKRQVKRKLIRLHLWLFALMGF